MKKPLLKDIKYFTALLPLSSKKDDVLKLTENDELLIAFARTLIKLYQKLNIGVYYQHRNIIITEDAYIVVLTKDAGSLFIQDINDIKGS